MSYRTQTWEVCRAKATDKNKSVKMADLYYVVSNKTPLAELIQNALIKAKKHGIDVFGAMDVMHNQTFLDDAGLKFKKDEGCLDFYVTNVEFGPIQPEKNGLLSV